MTERLARLREAETEVRATILYLEAADRGFNPRAYATALNKLAHIRADIREAQELAFTTV